MDSNSGIRGNSEDVPLAVEQQPELTVGPQLRPERPVNPHAENPPWTAIDLLVAAVIFIVTAVVLQFVLMHAVGVSAEEFAKNPTAVILVPSMMFGYVALLATMYLRVAKAQGLRFWNMAAWIWPKGMRWLLGLAGGLVLAVALGALAHVLPFPKSIPMERFFRDRQAAYILLVMGVAVAPFAEEMMFRGFLYPVLDRGLQTLFMVQRQLLNGVKWLLLAVGWGYLVHRIAVSHFLERGPANAAALLIALLAFLVIGFLVFGRWLRGKPIDSVLLSGLGLCIWGLVSHSISEATFAVTTSALLGLAVVLGAIGVAGGLSSNAAGRLGRILAILVTSAAFAMVHSEQLGEAWGPLLVIFIVGMVLTVTRVLTRSVAPGFLIHVGYNLTLFAGLFLGSDHFRHLERISQ
jgi:membrane protease YdiL (CAAX protease family)